VNAPTIYTDQMTTTGKNSSNDKDSNGSKKESPNKDSKNKENQRQSSASNNNKSNEVDKFKRFENEGVVFKAKLIGSELVMEPRGDKMCQNSIQRLKAIIKGTNSHKKRIVLKISYDGVKVYDEKTNEILHHHEVSQISYIASDDTDNRTFGYVSDVPSKAHQFICFKTSGPAINVMSVISGLFEAVLEKKNQLEKSKTVSTINSDDKLIPQQDSLDLIGDSGIMDGDTSIGSEDKQIIQQQTSSIIENDDIISPSNSFMSTNKNKQSASTDLIFDDLFSGLSDPIIVDKNDSLITYKTESAKQLDGSIDTLGLHYNQQQSQQQQESQQLLLQQHQRPNARPIPRRQNQQPVMLPPPSSLPRPAPMLASSGPSHNRSLVYNHSSVSLSDAALTRQTSFTSPNQNDGYVDRYAVFNDIDNLPSIFESTSLTSVNQAGVGAGTSLPGLDPICMTGMENTNMAAHSSVGEPTMHGIKPSQPIMTTKLNHMPIGMSNSNSNILANSLSSTMGSQRPSFQLASANSSFSQSFNQAYPQQSSSSFSPNTGALMNSAGPGTRSSSTNDANIFRQTNPFDDDFFA